MKKNVLCVFFIVLSTAIEAQHSISKNLFHDSIEDNWDPKKYLWSHIHANLLEGDKQLLDFNGIENWVSLGANYSLSISPNGQYFAYTLRKSRSKNWIIDSLILQSTNNLWRKSFSGASPGFFVGDGDTYIFHYKNVLYIIKTGSDSLSLIEGVLSYKRISDQKSDWIAYSRKDNAVVLLNNKTKEKRVFQDESVYSFESDKWFVCQLNSLDDNLIIHNLENKEEKKYSYVKDYKFDMSGGAFVISKCSRSDGGYLRELKYCELPSGLETTIWSNKDTNIITCDYTFDKAFHGVAFIEQKKDKNQIQKSIWYWKPGMERAIERLNNESLQLNSLIIKGSPLLTDNGKYIRFSISKKIKIVPPKTFKVQLDVWSHKDSVIYEKQLLEQEHPETAIQEKLRGDEYWGFISIKGGSMIVENDQERVINVNGDFSIISKSGKSGKGDRFWEDGYYKDSNWLVSLQDGSRKFLLLTQGPSRSKFSFSPNGKYLLYFDPVNGGNFISYDIRRKKVVNISTSIPTGTLLKQFDNNTPVAREGTSFGIASWQEDSNIVWVYDRYDIWQLDLTGNKRPINITNGFGRLHHITFRLMGSGIGFVINPTLQNNYVLLKAYNVVNKDNGFYRLQIGKQRNPEKLFMGPCILEKVPVITLSEDMIPLKAADVDVWIIKKESASDAPNYFLTKDFINFKQLTNHQPQQRYNWLTAEVHNYKQLNGKKTEGILYKPENFNPSKKYPVIIVFYTTASDRLHLYPTPDFFRSPVQPLYSPNWLVSQGYLVFMPDIDFAKGYWGPNTMNSVEGAARYLITLPFVDGKHIGASGHSNSGRFGYYLLTHSKSIAPMCIGAGTTNMVSTSLSFNRGESNMEWGEVESYGKGLGNLWKNKGVWLDHTAVLNADKVVSPLLLFHNKNDVVDFQQAIQLFTALRRLKKTVWGLQYDNGDHTLQKLQDLKDFTLRYTQFFDHYLKGAPAPKWMTRGVTAAMKGRESGYELDPAGNCGLQEKKCKICNKWNEQFKKTPDMFSRPLKEWSLNEDVKKNIE